jgi:dCTP deaminase
MLLNDRQIRELALRGMIDPFVDRQVRVEGGVPVISYGLSSFGYDVRIAEEFFVFSNVFGGTVVDPKAFPEEAMVRRVVGPHEAVVIPPNSYVLGRSVEYFRIPEDVMVVCVGKSTYARAGIIVNVTPLEPGWEGYITIEISNATPLPAKVYAHEGILQVLFFRGEPPEVTYAARGGKYQGQRGVVFARV